MKTYVVDFETYYDREYSLRKMTPVEYIMDPRFECTGMAVECNGLTGFLEAHQIPDWIAQLPERVTLVSHNSLFDMCVMAWRFNYVPTLMVDTMGLARAWLGWATKSFSLASVARVCGLGSKGDVIQNVMGMRAQDIKNAGLWPAYIEYGMNDAELCAGIYRKIMREGFPASEILVMDTVLRMGVCPKFVFDKTVLAEHLHNTLVEKENLFQRCGLSKSELGSNDKFAAALRNFGVEPPRKISPTTGKETYAFAKTDIAMQELEEHENPDVQALVAARLGVKSTIEESRAQRFISISNLAWPDDQGALYQPGWAPVPLKYSGAHTHRLSGEWKLNLQNLKRGGRLRDSLVTHKGNKVVAADASQIEARMTGWFCGQWDLVEQFRNKVDVYSAFATEVYGREITKKNNPDERFVGKTCVLGMGFGIGWPKFQYTIKTKSKIELGKIMDLTDQEAMRIVSVYRTKNARIASMWKTLGSIIPQMARPDCYIGLGPVTFLHEKVRLPNGMYLYYHNLHNVQTERGSEWIFEYNGMPKRIYGGKMLENIIQALARICTMDAAMRVRKAYHHTLDLALQCHDELVYVIEEELAQELYDRLIYEMIQPPVWAPELPLAAEGGIGDSYGDVK